MMWVSLIILGTHGKDSRYKFNYTEGQHEKLIKDFKEFYKRYPHASFYTVNLTKPTPPPPIRPNKRQTWCPYCAAERPFIYNKDLDVKQCVVCQVTAHNFYVLQYNQLHPKRREI